MLVVYLDRATNEYVRYENYPIGENFTKEKLDTLVENWNKNENNSTIIKVYEDPILAEVACDCTSSYRMQHLACTLKSICNQIQNSVDDLQSWTEDIEELLEGKDE